MVCLPIHIVKEDFEDEDPDWYRPIKIEDLFKENSASLAGKRCQLVGYVLVKQDVYTIQNLDVEEAGIFQVPLLIESLDEIPFIGVPYTAHLFGEIVLLDCEDSDSTQDCDSIEPGLTSGSKINNKIAIRAKVIKPLPDFVALEVSNTIHEEACLVATMSLLNSYNTYDGGPTVSSFYDSDMTDGIEYRNLVEYMESDNEPVVPECYELDNAEPVNPIEYEESNILNESGSPNRCHELSLHDEMTMNKHNEHNDNVELIDLECDKDVDSDVSI